VAIQIVPRNPLPDVEHRSASPEPSLTRNATVPIDREWNIADCWRAMYRRRGTIAWIVACGAILALLATAIQTPMYQSRASIQIQALNENFLNLRDIYPTASPSADNAVYIQTQAEILRQDALLEQVVGKLRLDERPEFHRRANSSALDELRRRVQILPARGSSIIQILCDAPDSKLAADLANTLAQTFIDQSVEARQRSAKETHDTLSIEREALREKLVSGEADLGALAKSGKDTAALRRELDEGRRFYQAISERIDQARVASTVNQSSARLVSPARPAARPYKPNFPLNLAIGTLAGLFLAIGYVMLREQTSSVLRYPGDASASLDISELGTIPQATSRRFPALRVVGKEPQNIPVERASLDPGSTNISEAFRATLASILSDSNNEAHPHVIGVTSPGPGEGKTTVVSNIAIALAEIGHKVLLIDADLRRPRLHRIFDQSNSWGLSDLLREKNAIEELPLETLVKRTTVHRLHLLPSGTAAANIFGLLWSGRMPRILAGFRQLFDYILIDVPPCLEFADARVVGRYVDSLLLVVRAGYTEKQNAQAAVERLRLDGTSVLGVIFNGCDPGDGGSDRSAASPQELA
jgi:receptor protein-tyrosine kinase